MNFGTQEKLQEKKYMIIKKNIVFTRIPIAINIRAIKHRKCKMKNKFVIQNHRFSR